jgi:hypothetical protein
VAAPTPTGSACGEHDISASEKLHRFRHGKSWQIGLITSNRRGPNKSCARHLRQLAKNNQARLVVSAGEMVTPASAAQGTISRTTRSNPFATRESL